jgi:predicted membrane-bound mannosyltransferase
MGTVTSNFESQASPEAPRYFFQPPPDTDPFRLERRAALLLILAAAWYVRALNASYCSAYMDESVYVLYGRMFLSRHFEAPIDEPLRWSFGWYLWPAMAAIADKLGGIVAVRELAAVLGTITVGAVYSLARRLFSPAVGLAAAAAFAILAPAIYNSRIATRDSGSLFFFAIGLWAYTRAFQENRKPDWLAASASFFAAFLCKYLSSFLFWCCWRYGKNSGHCCFSLYHLLSCAPDMWPSIMPT